MFEIYNWVEYKGNPARIVNKNSGTYYLVVLTMYIYQRKISSESKQVILT